MKIRKEALRTARQLLKASMPNGRVDEGRARGLMQRVIEEKPRQYVQILSAFQRLLKIEIEKRHAVIESSEPLSEAAQSGLVHDLKSRFGDDLTTEFKVHPDLVGGLRVKVGSTIWDGSVRGRLDSLRQAIGA